MHAGERKIATLASYLDLFPCIGSLVDLQDYRQSNRNPLLLASIGSLAVQLSDQFLHPLLVDPLQAAIALRVDLEQGAKQGGSLQRWVSSRGVAVTARAASLIKARSSK